MYTKVYTYISYKNFIHYVIFSFQKFIFMDLSFINVPTSKPELLELLKVAYNAGQNSMTPEMLDQLVSDRNRHKKKQQKKEFKHWLKLISQQWTDLKHS